MFFRLGVSTGPGNLLREWTCHKGGRFHIQREYPSGSGVSVGIRSLHRIRDARRTGVPSLDDADARDLSRSTRCLSIQYPQSTKSQLALPAYAMTPVSGGGVTEHIHQIDHDEERHQSPERIGADLVERLRHPCVERNAGGEEQALDDQRSGTEFHSPSPTRASLPGASGRSGRCVRKSSTQWLTTSRPRTMAPAR